MAVSARSVGTGEIARRALSRDEQVWELINAVQRLSLARSVGDVQEIVRSSARRLTGADGATFILREGEKCFYADEDAVGPLWKGQRFPMEMCISGWVMLNRRPVVIDDIYADDRIPHGAYRPTFVKSLAMVPIRTVDPIGAIGNYWARSYTPGDNEVELLKALADSTAVALENVRVYQELEQRAHTTAAFTFVSDGVVLADAKGMVRSWNPAAARITGVAEHHALGRRIDEVIPGWTDVAERIPVYPAGSGEAPRREALPFPLDGEEHWLSICGTSFIGGTVYTFDDVSRERALEEMRSDLIATVSHELRTPLAAVYGAATTLRRKSGALGTAAREQLLEMIETQANRLAAILEEILVAARLDAGTLSITAEPTDPIQLAGEVVEAARAAHPDAEVALVVPSALPVAVVDAPKVGQILRNLVENAINYAADGGPIEARVEADDRWLRFSVRDRGAGIPAGEQERIFEKFYRVNASTSARGTGLGLYICRELVRRMDGQIWVESTLGEGSTFAFELPV